MIRESTRYLALKEDEPPPKKLISERDILIKNLSKKQLNTDVNMDNYLNHQKIFEKISNHISLTTCQSGGSSLKEFKDIINKVEYIEYLKSAGLENDDIKLLLDYQRSNFDVKYKNIEKSILKNRINKIIRIVKEFGNKEVNDKRVVFKSCIDDIKVIEKNRFSHLQDEHLNPRKVQKRIRNINKRIYSIGNNYVLKNNEKLLGISTFMPQYVEETKWDSKTPKDFENNIEKYNLTPKKMATCTPKTYYTIKDGQIINLSQKKIDEICSLEINGNKLSTNDINKMPKFVNYTPGKPSNILYIKNLPKNIKESDLKQIFIDFLKVTFKIMTGRMKGQVFATFSDSNSATSALEKLNGLLINGKPMVMEYGRSGN